MTGVQETLRTRLDGVAKAIITTAALAGVGAAGLLAGVLVVGTTSSLARPLLLAAAAVAVVGALLTAIVTVTGVNSVRRAYAEPLASLVEVALRVQTSDFVGDASVAGPPQIRELAGSLNFLLRTLKQELRQGERVLDTVQSRDETAAEAARLHQQAQEESERDGLTGLFNRRRLDADMILECERSQRSRLPLSYVMVDVDHFKQFNDTYGHQGGDDLLRVMGELLRTSIRAADTAYRYGGEEFAVMLRGTPPDGAAILVDRLRVKVAEAFKQRGTPVTASFGISAVPTHGTRPTELIASADAALYEAKRQGRNRVILGPVSGTASG